MRLFREMRQSLRDTDLLAKKYYWITSINGLLAVAAWLGTMYVLVTKLGSILGVDIDAPTRDQENGTILALLFLVSIPFTMYMFVIVIAGSYGFLMYRLGNFSRKEAIEYGLYGKYPKYWFEEGKKTDPLAKKYQKIVSSLGLVGLLSGLVAICISGLSLAYLLGVDRESPVREQENGRIWFLLFFVSFPILFYFCEVAVRGFYGYLLYRRGNITRREVIDYAFRSKYPRYWFEEE